MIKLPDLRKFDLSENFIIFVYTEFFKNEL